MFYHAKNDSIKLGDTDMDYISFGTGAKNLIIIPGLGDGLKTVKGAAFPLAWMYRLFATDYTVYVFSRKNHLKPGYSTKDMAADQIVALKKLGISRASVMGISQGGMIAQYLAVDCPALVEKLVLAVTLCRQNDVVQGTVHHWISLANANEFKHIFIDTAEKTYSEKRLKKYRPLYPILSRMSRPRNLDRFMIQANACLSHDAHDEIRKIQCPTLVIGGDEDKIVGENAPYEIAEIIPNCQLNIYKGLGHGTYEEAKDFNRQVLAFLNAKI